MALNIKPADKKPLTAYQTDALGGLDPAMFEAKPANDPGAVQFGNHSVAAPLPQPGQEAKPAPLAQPSGFIGGVAAQDDTRNVPRPGETAAAYAQRIKSAGYGVYVQPNPGESVEAWRARNRVASQQHAAKAPANNTSVLGDAGLILGDVAKTATNPTRLIGDYLPDGLEVALNPVGSFNEAAIGAGLNQIKGAGSNTGDNALTRAIGIAPEQGNDILDVFGGLGGIGGGGTGTPLSGVVGGGGGNVAGRASAEAARGNIDSMLAGISDGSVMPGTSDATQRGVLNQAQSFQPIANTSSANQQGVLSQAQNFRPTNAQGALSSVQGFNPDGTQNALNTVNALDPTSNARGAVAKVDAFGNSVRPQTDVMTRTKAFETMSADELLAELEGFRTKAEGPSKAEILLSQANDDAMSNALSLARSGRGSVGDQSRQLQTAIGENAATSMDNARNMSLLRAEEEQQFRNQVMQSLGLSGEISGRADSAKLQALGIEGDLARSLDAGTLQALGLSTDLAKSMDDSSLRKSALQADLGKSLDDSTLRALGLETELGLGMDNSLLQALGIQSDTANSMRSSDVAERGQTMDATLRALGISADTANSMRNASVTERGQGLSALTSLTGTSAGLTGDILNSDTSLGVAGMNNANQNARLERELQYKLTPQQQLLLAAAGAGGDILSKFIG